MPNHSELTALLDRLRAEPRETEWLEFKTNRFEPQALGEYLSALANAASLLGKPRAYLVNLVAAPEGIRRVRKNYPRVPIFTAAVDRQLNGKRFILPGLGDAGDRLFGT